MSCHLTRLGNHLDIDAFIKKSKLRGFNKIYKGQPVFETKPQGRKMTYSQIGIQTSKAAVNDLKKQIKDTIGYLKRHEDKLKLIKKTDEVEVALLDFGINLKIDGKKFITNMKGYRISYYN